MLYLGGKAESAKVKQADFSKLPLEGIVVLDGTWAQAKTMWWRNPWLLKLKRIALNPSRRSLYGSLRREPRRECLSTIESIAEALDALGEEPTVGESLRADFAELLKKFRPAVPVASGPPK